MRKQRGGTLVEAALVILLLFTLLMAIIEFGRAYQMYDAVTNAAREGARFAVSPCASDVASCTYTANGTSYTFDKLTLPTDATIKARVVYFARSNSISLQPDQVTLANTTQCVNNVSVEYKSVQVTAPYKFILFRFGTMNLTSKAVMRNELSAETTTCN